jgi:hypothetical protein
LGSLPLLISKTAAFFNSLHDDVNGFCTTFFISEVVVPMFLAVSCRELELHPLDIATAARTEAPINVLRIIFFVSIISPLTFSLLRVIRYLYIFFIRDLHEKSFEYLIIRANWELKVQYFK